MIKPVKTAVLTINRRVFYVAAALLLLQLLALLPFLSGCGGGPTVETIAVDGNIEIDGVPVPKGSATFSPVTTGPAVGCEIKDGKFHCEVPVGTVRLSLIAQAAELREMVEEATGITRRVPQELLPPRYLQGFVIDLSPDAAKASECPEVTASHESGQCLITIRLVSKEEDSG